MTSTKTQISVIDMFTATTSSTEWGTIDDLYKAVSANSDLVEALLHGDVTERIVKQEIRRLIKQVKGDSGHAVFASVTSRDAEGNTITLYKQEALFDLDDYKQVIDYHGKRVIHHAQECVYFRKRCFDRNGEQLMLPFDPTSILLD